MASYRELRALDLLCERRKREALAREAEHELAERKRLDRLDEQSEVTND